MTRLLLCAGLLALLVASAATIGEASAKRLRVGTSSTRAHDRTGGVGEANYRGFRRALLKLGLEGRVLEVKPFTDPKPAYFALARQRYDLIVDAAPTDLSDLAAAAKAFPRVKFLVGDVRHDALQGGLALNVATYVLRIEEAAYLAGYLAAEMEKRRPGKDVIGSVGGKKYEQVDSFIIGYEAGARRADPGITTLNGYSMDFSAPAKCRSIALAQISRGAGAVFDVAGSCGLGALAAAKQKHVWGIGVDIDQSFLGPHILTSAVKRYDVALYSQLKAFKDGRFPAGRTTSLGLKENGVGLGKISPRVPTAVLRKLDRVRAQIVSGRINVSPRRPRVS